MQVSDISFEDPSKAEKTFQRLCQPKYYNDYLPFVNDRLLEQLKESVDPDLALNNVDRYLDACINRSATYSFFTQLPSSLDTLVKLCGGSQFIADILVRNPELFLWLLEGGQLNQKKNLEDYRNQAEEWVSPVHNLTRKVNATRRFHRRELLRIGARDILKLGDILDMAEELSDLASVLLDIALKSCTPKIEKEFGKPQRESKDKNAGPQFAVIGMGKLGGHELNFSSDIDVLFVYDVEGETTHGFSNHEYFSRLGEDLVKFLSEPTEQGCAYRIDLRLRPEGSAGPLVRSLESYEVYYQEFAETWERIALIKAHAVAGNKDVGTKFEELIVPFVYRRYLDYSSVTEIHHLKSRMQSEIVKKIESGIEIKSGKGGIREIEFYISILQLLHGGKYPELRIRNTCQILEVLMEKKIISQKQGEFLIEAYRFLRRVEQKLQLMHQLQTYHISGEQQALEKLSRRMEFSSVDDFLKSLQNYTQRVNEIFQSFFQDETVSELKETELKIFRLIDSQIEEEEVAEELKNYGFANTTDSRLTLQALAYGSQEHIVSPDERKRFTALLPNLLDFLKSLPNPDLGLKQFHRFVNKYTNYRSFYTWLSENKEVLERLLLVLSSSEHLGNLLIKEPGRFDSLITKLTEKELINLLEQSIPKYLSTHEIRKLWEEKILILGILNLINEKSHLTLSKKLSQIADKFINSILEKTLFEFALGKPDEVGLAILGLGKMGGQELTLGSDFDLVFIYADEETVSKNKLLSGIQPLDFSTACSIVEKLTKEMQFCLGAVDLRLRPEGKDGALALTPGPFKKYFEKRASFWERLAWMKSRYVAGNSKLAKVVLKDAMEFVYGKSMTSKSAKEIWTMRMKMQKAIKPDAHQQRDMKVGMGGLVDLEFAIQYLLLLHGHKNKRFHNSNIYEGLKKLHTQKKIDKKAFTLLQENYLFFTQLQNRLRLMSNFSNNLIPEDKIELFSLSRLMSIPNPKVLIHSYQEKTKRNRKVLKEILERNSSK